MRKIVFTVVAFCVFCQFGFGQTIYPNCTELFFSQYVEGSAKNRAIEIYNPTLFDVDLSIYAIKVFTNGPQNPNVLQLSGPLGSKQVYTCGHNQAPPGTIALCDITSAQLKFDGDDAVGLYKNDTLIDMIGVIGQNPGVLGWQVGIGYTKDNTLIRGADVRGPTAYWSQSQFEWIVEPNDDVAGLGDHDAVCALAQVFLSSFQVGSVVEANVTINLRIDVAGVDSLPIMIRVNHNPPHNCLDPDFANYGNVQQQGIDYSTPYGNPIGIQAPSFFTGILSVPIQIFDDNEMENDEGICFELVAGPGYFIIDNPEDKYKHTLIIEDDGDTGIEEALDSKLKVYPTLTDGIITIDGIRDYIEYRMTVYDVFGKELYRQENRKGGSSYTIDVNEFASGMYVMAFEGEGWKVTRKFIRD